MTAEIIEFKTRVVETLKEFTEATSEPFPDIAAPAIDSKEEPTEREMQTLKESLAQYEHRLYNCTDPVEFLKALKLALISEDYENVLCACMDDEYYEGLDPDGKRFVDCYFSLLNPGPRGSAA